MRARWSVLGLVGVSILAVTTACGGASPVSHGVTGSPIAQSSPVTSESPSASATLVAPASSPPLSLAKVRAANSIRASAAAGAPTAGVASGAVAVPADARAVDTSHPTRVIGTGTPASCTSAAVATAVAAGGIITFSCGPAPVTIAMTATAKVVNTSAQVVLDGGGRVTLDGGGSHRILYMNTCDQAQVWTTSHCQDQPTPALSVQGLTFANGNSTGQTVDGGGGGAIFVRGGRVKIVNSTFVGNRCEASGPDLGGAAVRVLSQSSGQPVYVVGSTFSGGRCSNGGALSSIGVSWVVVNSVFSNNQAIGSGANPAASGTPGGGSGGAIYTDGNQYTVSISGSVITQKSRQCRRRGDLLREQRPHRLTEPRPQPVEP